MCKLSVHDLPAAFHPDTPLPLSATFKEAQFSVVTVLSASVYSFSNN